MVEASTARRWWSVGIGLAVSAAALAGLVLVEGRAAQADADVVALVRAVGAERTAAASAAGQAADPVADLGEPDWSGVQGKMRRRTGASVAKSAVPAEPLKQALGMRAEAVARDASRAGDSAAGAAVMPDFVGKRLAAARREARKLGIKLVMRDEGGDRIAADEARWYTVRAQSIAAGSSLQPGATLSLRARMPVRYAMGY